jgi:hypothetical protein
MPTQLKMFSARKAGDLARLEREVNDWLVAKGSSIQPVNSQTATCFAADDDGKPSQAVVIALWYLDPPPEQ